MRIATYNVEWFTNLFDDGGRLLADDEASGREGVSRRDQAEALGIVFTAMPVRAVQGALICSAWAFCHTPDQVARRSSLELQLQR